jgi:hypothetical protein
LSYVWFNCSNGRGVNHCYTVTIPIWELLKITEEQYDKLYKTPVVDVSNSVVEELEKEE